MVSSKTSWRVLRKLGEGGVGEVCLAQTPEGRKVAVKTLARAQRSQVPLFEHEASLLIKLRHPAIASVLGYAVDSSEIFGEDRGPCFWMEYVEGEDILTSARHSIPKKIFQWFQQALEALQALHAQGILHSDLSPKNVLVTKEGQIKLLDFGLASAFGKTPSFKAGTIPYMAPERISGKNLPASDLFSLGTIFYEALAGHHPRADAKSLHEMMSLDAKPLLEAVPELAKDYSIPVRVIDRMIAVSLDQRFTQAREVLEALRGAGTREEIETAEFHSAQMFGAKAAFQVIEKSFREISQHSNWLAVHGITGVGKKRLLRELAFQGAMQGIQVHEISATQFKTGLSSFLETNYFSKASTRAWHLILFRSTDLVPFSELASLISLRRRGLPENGLLLVLEWNEDGLNEETRPFFSSLLGWEEVQEIHLKNLSPAHTRDLLQAALGLEVAEQISDKLFSQTQGNPRLLLETIKILREQRIASKKHFSKEWLKKIDRLVSFEDVLLFRIQQLSAAEREILLDLAAAHYPVDLKLLELMRGPSPGLRPPSPRRGEGDVVARDFNTADVLRSLIDRELVRYDSETGLYSLALPTLEAGLLKQISPEELQGIHRRCLQILKTQPPSDPQKLHHALALNEVPLITEGTRPVVEIFHQKGERHRALEILAEALPFIVEPAERSRLLRAKTNLLNELGRFAEALENLEASFALAANDEPMRLKTVKYWFGSGLAHQNLGNEEEAARRFQRAIESGESSPGKDTDPFRVRAHSLLGLYEFRKGNLNLAKENFQKGLALAGPKGRRRAELCRHQALVFAAEGNWNEAGKNFEEAKRLYREERFFSGEFTTLLEEGNEAMDFGKVEMAEEAYRAAESLAKKNDDDLLLALAWNNQGVMARKRGELGKAIEFLGRAEEIFRPLSDYSDLAENLCQRAIAEAAVGHFSMAKGMIQELQGLSEKNPKAKDLADRAQSFLAEVQSGRFQITEEKGPAGEKLEDFWNKEFVIRKLAREGQQAPLLKKLLSEIYEKLPTALQVSFVERWDFQKFVEHKENFPGNSNQKGRELMNILESLSTINRELLREENMGGVFEKLMDAAMQLSQAENGFLVLRSEDPNTPIPGFNVVVARNLKKEILHSTEFAISRSALRQAMETGEPVVTDNALTDPRFAQAKSVQLHELKSILALPLMGSKGALGVFYLDHRFEAGLFTGETLTALKAFADQAALALQKAQMVEDLKKANEQLFHQVEEQTDQMQLLEKELAENRLILKHEYSDIVGRSPKMVQVLSLVDRITDSKIPVYIYGESGTGKESIARALHFNSPRAKYPFVGENCSALPETLLESELFGHKRGAFTHADKDKIGRLQYADKGTVFLDEIGDMSLNLQSKLLRFLQEGEVRPLGSNEVMHVDVRVVSASNRELGEMVKQGLFREDLFFRLNGIGVTLPALRDRREDIPLLVDHFLKKIAQREKKEPCRVNNEAMKSLLNFYWPGNIRELLNTLETAVLFADRGVINARSLHFKPELFEKKKSYRPPTAAKGMALESLDPELEPILLAIRDAGYHKGNAAKALKISRRNLYSKLEKFKVPVELNELKNFIDERFV